MKKFLAIAFMALAATACSPKKAEAHSQHNYSLSVQAPPGTQIYVGREYVRPPVYPHHQHHRHHQGYYRQPAPQWIAPPPPPVYRPYRQPGMVVPTFAPTGCNTYWDVQVGAWLPCR